MTGRPKYNFYRAMLCTARTMSSQDVCPSVRLSVCHTPVFCRNSYMYPETFFAVGFSQF